MSKGSRNSRATSSLASEISHPSHAKRGSSVGSMTSVRGVATSAKEEKEASDRREETRKMVDVDTDASRTRKKSDGIRRNARTKRLHPKQEEPKGSTAGSDCFPHTHTHTLSILVKSFGRKQVRLSHCFRAHHLALHSHLRMRPTTWTLSMRTTLPFVSCSLPLRSRSRLSISRVDPIDIPFQGPGFPFRFGRKDDR